MSLTEEEVVAKIDEWEEKGPFTFEEAFKLAELCCGQEDLCLSHTLDDNYHLFDDEELVKLLNPTAHLKRGADRATWHEGTENWAISTISQELTDSQLELILAHQPKAVARALKNHPTCSSDQKQMVMLKALREVSRLDYEELLELGRK